MQRKPAIPRQADTFICHASEDKDAIARPLHEAFRNAGVNSWLDESNIRLGQSIRQEIDYGLANCRSATVILSRPFFEKHWTGYEMDGIVGRAMQEEILLFPIQHGITFQEIRTQSPSLAGLQMWNSSVHSLEDIANEVADLLGIERRAALESAEAEAAPQDSNPVIQNSPRAFGTFYIAPAGTAELPPEIRPEADTRLVYAIARAPEGWIPVLDDNEELEYVIENELLRVRLTYGDTLTGIEITASGVVSGEEPFALTIRKLDGSQEYFPSITNRAPSSAFWRAGGRSGWMSFQIG